MKSHPTCLPTPPHPPPRHQIDIEPLKASPLQLTFQIQRMISPQFNIIVLIRDRPIDLQRRRRIPRVL
jgi:hypothetical protein